MGLSEGIVWSLETDDFKIVFECLQLIQNNLNFKKNLIKFYFENFLELLEIISNLKVDNFL
jgi:hypothetical protein